MRKFLHLLQHICTLRDGYFVTMRLEKAGNDAVPAMSCCFLARRRYSIQPANLLRLTPG
jgi:hypothetical protein